MGFKETTKTDYMSSDLYIGLKMAKLLYKSGLHQELLELIKKAQYLFLYFYNDGDIENILEYYKATYINLMVREINKLYTKNIGELYEYIYSNAPDDIAEKFPTPEEIGI